MLKWKKNQPDLQQATAIQCDASCGEERSQSKGTFFDIKMLFYCSTVLPFRMKEAKC